MPLNTASRLDWSKSYELLSSGFRDMQSIASTLINPPKDVYTISRSYPMLTSLGAVARNHAQEPRPRALATGSDRQKLDNAACTGEKIRQKKKRSVYSERRLSTVLAGSWYGIQVTGRRSCSQKPHACMHACGRRQFNAHHGKL